MNKLKKEISEMRHYLGADVEGLKRLSCIERLANDTRKNAASEKERADKCQSCTDELRAELIATNNKCESIRDQLRSSEVARDQYRRDSEQSRKIADSLRLELDRMMSGDPVAENPDETDDDRVKELESVFKFVRKKFRRAPKPARVIGTKKASDFPPLNKLNVWEITDIVPDLSRENLLILGAIAATLARFGIGFVLESKWHMHDDLYSDKTGVKWLQWVGSIVDTSVSADVSGVKVPVESYQGEDNDRYAKVTGR